MAIEVLESRIAPAAVLPTISPDGRSATWTDVDGDVIKLRITIGTLDASVIDLEGDPLTGQAILQGLDLTAELFAGTAVKITAKRSASLGGDGAVNVGFINAADNTLGKVSIAGDLTRIDAGKAVLDSTTPKALAGLTVRSMGLFGEALLDTPAPLVSELSGKVGPIVVAGNIEGVFISAVGGKFGSIKSVAIGGSLIGTDDADSGRITASGKIGPITITGNILGGAGQNSGAIESASKISSVTLGGSIVGGKGAVPSNNASGIIRADGPLGPVIIGGSIYGGTQQSSGVISTGDRLTSLTVAGSIVGGDAGTTSGVVSVAGAAGAIVINGDLVGGAAIDSGHLSVLGEATNIAIGGAVRGGDGRDSGAIDVGATSAMAVGSLSIGREVRGGDGPDSGTIQIGGGVATAVLKGGVFGGSGENSGAFLIGGDAGAVTIGSDLVGSAADNSGQLVIAGNATSVVVRGAVRGADGIDSGSISLGSADTSTVGSLVVGREVRGGAGDGSGTIQTSGQVTQADLRGGLFGGSGSGSGVLTVGNLTTGSISAGIFGGTGAGSGSVLASGTIKTLNVTGIVLGGTADATGNIRAVGAIKNLNITGDLVGGDLADDATEALVESGYVQAQRIGKIQLGGSIRAGIDYSATFDLEDSAGIRVSDDLKRLEVQGSIIGNAASRVLITARGQSAVPVDTRIDQALGALTVRGSVLYSDLLAGYDLSDDLTAASVNPNAQIYTLSVGGDWVASNLVAGAGFNAAFGDGTDKAKGGLGSPDILARIGGIAIAGQILGTAEDTGDHFGFIAEQIVSFNLGTAVVTPPPALPNVGTDVPFPVPPGPNGILLNTGPRDDIDLTLSKYQLGTTGDVRIFEFRT